MKRWRHPNSPSPSTWTSTGTIPAPHQVPVPTRSGESLIPFWYTLLFILGYPINRPEVMTARARVTASGSPGRTPARDQDWWGPALVYMSLSSCSGTPWWIRGSSAWTQARLWRSKRGFILNVGSFCVVVTSHCSGLLRSIGLLVVITAVEIASAPLSDDRDCKQDILS